MKTYCAKYYIAEDMPRFQMFDTERAASVFIETMRAHYAQQSVYFAFDIYEVTA